MPRLSTLIPFFAAILAVYLIAPATLKAARNISNDLQNAACAFAIDPNGTPAPNCNR